MLAKRHRLLTADDYRLTVRQGRRLAAKLLIVYWRPAPGAQVPRFGVIASRAVGNAVVRNTVRRRVKSICHAHLVRTVAGDGPAVDVVIRMLPGAAQAGWVSLEAELSPLLAATLSHPVGLPPAPDRHRPAAIHRTASE